MMSEVIGGEGLDTIANHESKNGMALAVELKNPNDEPMTKLETQSRDVDSENSSSLFSC